MQTVGREQVMVVIRAVGYAGESVFRRIVGQVTEFFKKVELDYLEGWIGFFQSCNHRQSLSLRKNGSKTKLTGEGCPVLVQVLRQS